MKRVSNRTPRRESLASRIERVSLPNTKRYAGFIRRGDEGGLVPCWGAIAQRFLDEFGECEERLLVLDALIADGDARPLCLFLHTARDRPTLLRVLCERAGELPTSIQWALAAMPEAGDALEMNAEQLTPSALAVWTGSESRRAVERELFEARVNELLSFTYFVPDVFEPASEGDRHRNRTHQ